LPSLDVELRQQKTELAFYTKPSLDQVVINCDPLYESVEFELVSEAIQCIDSFEVQLCEMEKQAICLKGELNFERRKLSFQNLIDNTIYEYQVYLIYKTWFFIYCQTQSDDK